MLQYCFLQDLLFLAYKRGKGVNGLTVYCTPTRLIGSGYVWLKAIFFDPHVSYIISHIKHATQKRNKKCAADTKCVVLSILLYL
jgi:hypothetical protein